MPRKDTCPSCGGPKDVRSRHCLACRQQPSPQTVEAVVAASLAAGQRTDEGCLLDTLRRPWNGYVTVGIGGRQIKLHRLVMQQHLGRPLTPDETVDHVCHNQSDCNLGADCPHRRCIEIAHLEVVDQPTNWRRGRLGVVAQRRAKTHCPANHPYAGRNLYILPSGARACRACHRARHGGRDPRVEPAYV